MKKKRFLFFLVSFICLAAFDGNACLQSKSLISICIPGSFHQRTILAISLPFWKSWWLTAFMAFLVTLVIFFYIRLRTNSLINQNIQLEEKVNLMSHQLQDKNTELSNKMESLRRLQNQLIVSEKMASLGQLTAGIAHEIQNPLNFVNNFSELSVELLQELEVTATDSEKKSILDDIKQNLEKIVSHGKRADSIVKGMLQNSRKASPEKIPTDINKLVEEFFVLAYHGMRAKDPGFNCILEKLLEPGLPLVPVIPQDVSRVILNIFNNSFYAVDERGKIEDKNYKPKVSISTRRMNGNIIIKIHDNGKGIPSEIREKIFNPFFTTKPSGEGTGLGLSISYDIIVNGHNGQLFVDSVPGEFSEFTITLPIK